MEKFKRISVKQAKKLIENQHVRIVDVRNESDFEKNNIPNAIHLSQYNFAEFVDSANKQNPLIVYCYCGIKSQMMARRLVDNGFEEVYSLDGGFNAWLTSASDRRVT